MKQNEMLMLGGAGLVAYLLLGNKTKSTPSASTLLSSGSNGSTGPGSYTVDATHPPLTFDVNYYEKYQYPLLTQQNPNLLNPNYQLSQAEADQYLNNYTHLKQALPQWVPSLAPNLLEAVRRHWRLYGPQNKYSFMPFRPTDDVPYTPPPPAPNSSGSGWISDVLGIATSVVALLGVSDEAVLNDGENVPF